MEDRTMDVLIEVLDYSLRKNGDKPITIKHMRNILKQANRKVKENDKRYNAYMTDALNARAYAEG